MNPGLPIHIPQQLWKAVFLKKILVDKPSQTKRLQVGPGWNLKSDTSNILFTPQKAVIRKQCFMRSKFINIFFAHCGVDSPWCEFDGAFLIQTLVFTPVEQNFQFRENHPLENHILLTGVTVLYTFLIYLAAT
jgi:hypothetical protein